VGLPADGIPLPSPDLAFPPDVDPFLLYAAHRQRMAPPASVGGVADVSRRMSAFAHRPSRGLSVKMLTPLSPDKMVGMLPPLESLEKHLGLTVVASAGGHSVVPNESTEPHSRPHPAASQTLLLGRSYPAPPVLQALLPPPAPVNRFPRDPSVVLARSNHDGMSVSSSSSPSTSSPIHTDRVSSGKVGSPSSSPIITSPPSPHIKTPVMGTPSRRTDLPPIFLLQHAMKQAEPLPLVRPGHQHNKAVLNAFAPLLVDHVPVPPAHLLTRASVKREPVIKLVAGAASKIPAGNIVYHDPAKETSVGRPGTNHLLPGPTGQPHAGVKSVQPRGHGGHSQGYSHGTFGHGPVVPVPLMAHPAEILQAVSPPVPHMSQKTAGTRTIEAWSPSKKDAPVFAPIGERPNWM
jgi:hypothetical protein